MTYFDFSPLLFFQIIAMLSYFFSVVCSNGAGLRSALVHRLVARCALVPNFAKSLSRTFTGARPGSLMIVVVGEDLVT